MAARTAAAAVVLCAAVGCSFTGPGAETDGGAETASAVPVKNYEVEPDDVVVRYTIEDAYTTGEGGGTYDEWSYRWAADRTDVNDNCLYVIAIGDDDSVRDLNIYLHKAAA